MLRGRLASGCVRARFAGSWSARRSAVHRAEALAVAIRPGSERKVLAPVRVHCDHFCKAVPTADAEGDPIVDVAADATGVVVDDLLPVGVDACPADQCQGSLQTRRSQELRASTCTMASAQTTARAHYSPRLSALPAWSLASQGVCPERHLCADVACVEEFERRDCPGASCSEGQSRRVRPCWPRTSTLSPGLGISLPTASAWSMWFERCASRSSELLLSNCWQAVTRTGSHVLVDGSEPDEDAVGRPVPLTPLHTAGMAALWEKHGRRRIGVGLNIRGGSPSMTTL